jgi:hypothetical protein
MERADADLQAVATVFIPEPHRIVLLGGSSGFSASRFARVETARAAWCLRRWPPGFPPERLKFIHSVLIESRACGFRGVPDLALTRDGGSIVTLDGMLFDMQTWMSGTPASGTTNRQRPMPNRPHRLPAERLATIAVAVATFHRSTKRLITNGSAPRRPLLQQARKVRADVLAVVDGLNDRHISSTRVADRAVVRRWLGTMLRTVERAVAILTEHEQGATDTGTVCHGDIWGPHILFEGAMFSGLVDFETLALTSPTHDLAQLITHFNGWGERSVVLEAYGRVNALDSETYTCLPAAAALDLAGEACWSLRSLYGTDRPALDNLQRDAHQSNLRGLLPSFLSLFST